MSHTARIPYFKLAPAQMQGMMGLSASVAKSALGARMLELVFLRVSQLNGCGFCMDMHWRALVKDGADPRHLNTVAGWRESPFFSERERAALQWAEACNAIAQRAPGDAEFDQLKAVFSDAEIAELTFAIASIRAWNTVSVSMRNPIPETPAPGM